jgi:ankyrin repeat protein
VKKQSPKELTTDLCMAAAKADVDSVKQLLAQGADVNGEADKLAYLVIEQTPLWAAVMHAAHRTSQSSRNLCEALRSLFPHVAPTDHVADRQKYFEIIGILVNAGADLEKKSHGSTPLYPAINHGDLELVTVLLARGANPNAETFSILSQLAVTQGRKRVPGYFGTVLHHAVEKNSLPIVSALVAAGADVTRRDHEGKTPAQVATEKGYLDILRVLSDHEAPSGPPSPGIE